jgi:hypothetical protein
MGILAPLQSAPLTLAISELVCLDIFMSFGLTRFPVTMLMYIVSYNTCLPASLVKMEVWSGLVFDSES